MYNYSINLTTEREAASLPHPNQSPQKYKRRATGQPDSLDSSISCKPVVPPSASEVSPHHSLRNDRHTNTELRGAAAGSRCRRTPRVLPTQRPRCAGSRAQPTAHYKEAATVCITNSSTKRFQSQHLHKNSHHLKKVHSQQQSKGSRNQPSCPLTGRAQTTHAQTSARAPTHRELQLYTAQRTTDKMLVRQHLTSRCAQ
ncbi:hypothetical protein FHG87_017606 [Trinorchestia longiramus]|nr:hypothetical protein FHG87_017606 [Trinorchestia longiramus]